MKSLAFERSCSQSAAARADKRARESWNRGLISWLERANGWDMSRAGTARSAGDHRTAAMQIHWILMKYIRQIFAFVLILAGLSPALAADPVYPPGLRIGLVPIQGLFGSKAFPGFETEDHAVKVLVAELPPAAYGEVQNAFKTNSFPGGANAIKPESLQTGAGEGFYTVETAKDGADTVRRFSMIVSGGTFSGYVAAQVPESATKTFSDDAVRQMFASAVARKEVPVDEQLGLMPFKITELGSFKNVRTLAPGAALLFADGDEVTGIEAAPYMVIGTISSAPA